MSQPTDYEYEAMQKRTQQEAAIRAENKRDWKRFGARLLLHVAIVVIISYGALQYRLWLDGPFTPPQELLTESEFRELVEGYQLLAEAMDGSCTENVETVERGHINAYQDLDGDGEWDVRVRFLLHGMYADNTLTLREEAPYVLGGFARRYSIFELDKGTLHQHREESIWNEDHTAYLSITVKHPSADHAEYRRAVDDMLRIVRGC